jgi:hypothetical protein
METSGVDGRRLLFAVAALIAGCCAVQSTRLVEPRGVRPTYVRLVVCRGIGSVASAE